MDMSAFTSTQGSEKVNEMDEELRKELEELKSELEENEVVHGIFPKETSSVAIPQNIDHFKRERKRIIGRLLQVSEAMPLKDQAQIMREEASIAEEREYTVNSLPLILHQYFIDRIQAVVFAKHQHLLRWRRFCEHTEKIEALYPAYTKKLQKYLGEYQDAVQRAQRLNAAKTHLTGGKDPAFTVVKVDDMIIYLRWLICHLHSIKRFNYFMKVLKWLHINHKMDICLPRRDDSSLEDSSAMSKTISLRYQDDPAYSQSKGQIGGSRPASATAAAKSATPVPAPPPLNLAILTTQVLPNSAMIYAAAAAGGGLASDESHLGLPLNDVDFTSLKPHLQYLINIYGIVFDLGRVQSTADEMEMFAAINRRFRHFFVKQEHLRTFHTYDVQQEGVETEKSTHTFKQVSNWLPYVELQPEEEANQLKRWTQLRQANKVDELLRVKAHFLRVSDIDKVQEALKEHAAAVQKPPEIKAHSVTSHRTPNKTMKVWKRIYTDPELFTERSEEKDIDMFNMDEKECDQVNFKADKRNKKKKEGYDYQSTIQMLGLDDGEQDSKDPVTVQGAFLSFITLRHLRLRDLQRSCLSVLNYFRSIERTLTIYDGGLSLEDKNVHRTSNQDHREATESSGTQGGGGGLGCHAYLHNTPADYKISECQFMEFGEIENHDDFYTLEEGRVHVVDQRGYHIMYDSAIQDLDNLEKDLLLVGTYYIEKDRDLRRVSKINPTKKRSQEQTAGDFDMASYAHQEVDRFGVLLDLWSNECAFLECKREVVDCYFESYQNAFDRDERRKLAQVLTNLLYQRPRFDFTSNYFVHTYRTECIILRHHATLVKSVMDRQIDDEREFNQKVCRMGDSDYGLPDKIIPKQPIAINLSRPALKNVYMLEFHPSLALSSRIPGALKYTQREVINSNKPDTVTEALMLEKKMIELAIKDWEQLPDLGFAYASNVRRDLYGENFVEDPVFMVEVAKTMIEKVEKEGSRKSVKERHKDVVGAICDLLEVITLRYRIMEAANETDVLSKVYRNQAAMMGYEEHHLFMRCVQFEFASYKEDAGKPPPVFITAVHEDDSSIDRYVPPHLWLAIHELDEGHVGKFTFQHREGVLQATRPPGLQSLQVILKAQVVHKNALVSAVEMVDSCHQLRELEMGKSGRVSPIETKSEKSTLTQMTGNSTATQGTPYAGGHSKDIGRRAPESFVSLQMEKNPSRQLMLNEYWQKKQSMGAILKNMEEAEKLKRGLISTYCDRVCNRVSQYALRAQIISYYYSILYLLDDFPQIRNTYFMIGEPNEKKSKDDSIIGLATDPRTFKKRPRMVISEDGAHVLNLWFIPHFMETLIMFKFMEDTACARALSFLLSIVSSLHDMLQYACAHARLGSAQARLGSRRLEGVSADWGGTEGIAAELRDIQTQVNSLLIPTSPEMVAEFLALRRDVMFLELDTAVRHSMADTFLATGNIHAYNAVSHSRYHALPAMSNIQRQDVCSFGISVPEPFEARDAEARMYFPWRSFLGRNGPFTVNFSQWYLIDFFVQYCLAGLRDVDRHVANGEILGVTLLMEDVLQTGQEELNQEGEDTETASQAPSVKAKSLGEPNLEAETSLTPAAPPVKNSLSRSKQPVLSFALLRNFLLLWKCLELVKMDWGRRKLKVEKINTPSLYRDFCKIYRTEILLPTLQSVGRRLGQGDLYEGLVLDTDVLVMPKGASEVEVRGKQLYRLLETLEVHMITDLRKKISRELNLAISERAREEGTLPTDLWKKSVMKESFTVPKAHVAENFAIMLLSEMDWQEGEQLEQYTFSKEHLQKCMLELSHNCMARERACFENYAMYYENILKTQHHILYQREQELKRAQDELKVFHQNVTVEVQCELANCAHDLLMEITALRAKIVEMREMMMSQERDLRERVKDDYDDLIQNIFSSTFLLRSKFDKYRVDLVEDVYDKINETRREAVEAMAKLKAKHSPVGEEDSLMGVKSQAEQIRELQHENLSLYKLIVELRTLNGWRHSHSTNHFMRLLADVRKRLERSQKECTEIQMLAEEEVILLRQQLLSVKKSLATAELECNEVRKKLEKELRIKMEKSHEIMQKERSKKQLEAAKQANYEKLLDELDDKDTQLLMMQDEKEKRVHIEHMSQDKIKRDMTDLKKQLLRERNLKLDAFHRVDDLQAQVYDYESVIMSTAHSAIAFSNTATPLNRSRATSAQLSRRTQATSRGTANVSSAQWAPHVVWPAYRSLTPMPEGANGLRASELRRVQRPKTVGGRLRSRLAEQLLNEIDTEPQQQAVQFEYTEPL